MEMGVCANLHHHIMKAETSSEGESSSSTSRELPEEVLPLILSNTAARDVGRLAVVSRNFAEAAKSDLVWRKMLPPNYEWVVKNALEFPIRYQSLNGLYERFCKHILVGEGLEVMVLTQRLESCTGHLRQEL